MAETNIPSWRVGALSALEGLPSTSFYGELGDSLPPVLRIRRVGLLGKRPGMVTLADGSVEKPLMNALSNIKVQAQAS